MCNLTKLSLLNELKSELDTIENVHINLWTPYLWSSLVDNYNISEFVCEVINDILNYEANDHTPEDINNYRTALNEFTNKSYEPWSEQTNEIITELVQSGASQLMEDQINEIERDLEDLTQQEESEIYHQFV